jgi:hypothetical protein
MNNNKNEIVLYQPDNSVNLEVWLENETVWLTQAQIGAFFGVDRTVSKQDNLSSSTYWFNPQPTSLPH